MTTLNFWIALFIIFLVSIGFRFYFKKSLAVKVKNDELFPRVKEMLVGKITRNSITEARNKLASEGIDPKRISTLISASVYAKQPKYTLIINVLTILILAFIIIRQLNVPRIITPIGPNVYKNTEQNYELNLPDNWVGITNPKSPGDTYFTDNNNVNNSPTYPTAIEIQSEQTSKDTSSSTVQQQILQSVYTGLEKQNPAASFSTDFLSVPPYLDYTDVNKNSQPFHSRWYYFFGNGRVYAFLVTTSQNSWASTILQLEQIVSSFKIDSN